MYSCYLIFWQEGNFDTIYGVNSFKNSKVIARIFLKYFTNNSVNANIALISMNIQIKKTPENAQLFVHIHQNHRIVHRHHYFFYILLLKFEIQYFGFGRCEILNSLSNQTHTYTHANNTS